MTLEDLGYTAEWENVRATNQLGSFGVGRVIAEHKERYVVRTAEHEYEGEVIGNLRFSARSRSDFPAVGDWVATSAYDDDKVLIHAVFPRKTVMERQAVGKQGEKQVIAANIDYAFVVQAADRDFNLNRIERTVALCHAAHVKPLILLNKTDLVEAAEVQKLMATVVERMKQVPVMAISNVSGAGLEKLKAGLEKGRTYCLLGSSGVGKSSLLNKLAGEQRMKTNAISSSSQRGRHVTSHRELFVLSNGGILIDNPGMREVGITDAGDALEMTFDSIVTLAAQCRFKDCTHTTEAGCAVMAAVESGELDEAAYGNYLKMEREKAHFESTVAEKRRKDKEFGKMIKHFKKDRKSNKY